jgi:hypothetical protein
VLAIAKVFLGVSLTVAGNASSPAYYKGLHSGKLRPCLPLLEKIEKANQAEMLKLILPKYVSDKEKNFYSIVPGVIVIKLSFSSLTVGCNKLECLLLVKVFALV